MSTREEMIAHDRRSRRSPTSSAPTRSPTSRWRASTRRSGRPPTTTATPASRATTRSAIPRTRTASSRSRRSPSSPPPGLQQLSAAFRIAVLASGGGTNLQAILDKLHGQDGFEVVAVASDKPRREALERARKAGVETEVFARADYEDREARDAAMAEWLDGARGRPDRARRVHAAALARVRRALPRAGSSTCTPRFCPPSPASTRSDRRSSTASGSPGSPSTSSTRGSTRGRSSSSGAVPVPRAATARRSRSAIHAAEHELLPEAIRLIAAGRVSLDPDNPRGQSMTDSPMSTEAQSTARRERRRAAAALRSAGR